MELGQLIRRAQQLTNEAGVVYNDGRPKDARVILTELSDVLQAQKTEGGTPDKEKPETVQAEPEDKKDDEILRQPETPTELDEAMKTDQGQVDGNKDEGPNHAAQPSET